MTFNVASLNLAVGGTFWIDYQLTLVTGTTAFNPAATYQDIRSNGTENGRQFNATWVDLGDAGTPATAADVFQDVPFILTGQPVPEPATIAALGLGAMALIRRRRK